MAAAPPPPSPPPPSPASPPPPSPASPPPPAPRGPGDYTPDLRPMLILAALLVGVILGWVLLGPLILPKV